MRTDWNDTHCTFVWPLARVHAHVYEELVARVERLVLALTRLPVAREVVAPALVDVLLLDVSHEVLPLKEPLVTVDPLTDLLSQSLWLRVGVLQSLVATVLEGVVRGGLCLHGLRVRGRRRHARLEGDEVVRRNARLLYGDSGDVDGGVGVVAHVQFLLAVGVVHGRVGALLHDHLVRHAVDHAEVQALP